jgi:hypothetical protein
MGEGGMIKPCSILGAYTCRPKAFLKLAALLITIPWSLAWGSDPGWLADASTIGISAGAKAPDFELPDQGRRMRKLASLMGRRGLVLVFFRSDDW